MMSGVLTRGYTMESSPAEGSRNLGNGRHSPTSPLKIFGKAKKKINDIFNDIGSYIGEGVVFLKSVNSDDGLIKTEQLEEVTRFQEKVSGITEILSRDRMKVAFFGRTSNGKSTVINAMLKDKVLPSGLGHTTHCFVQVEASETADAYLLTENSPTPQNLKSLDSLAHALSTVKLKENSLIRILWPKDKCNLLKDDVILVDSPGIDVSPNLDTWIDEQCLDADVFVLVANAESTLMQTEKNFFHKVSTKLSKPNIFVLNNRWDASAMEPETMEEVKEQHLQRCKVFLVDELKVVEPHEAEDRVFFVSAKEALYSRLHQEKGTPTPSGTLAEGFQGRLFEFANFERKFEECISKSAVHTKFAQHTVNGKNLCTRLRTIMEEVGDLAVEKKDQCHQQHQEAVDKLDYTDKQLVLLTTEIKDKIKQMTEDVERKVANALNEEIRRLAILVDEFDRPFHPDHMLLNVYKKELHAHVELGLGRNLQMRLSTALTAGVEVTSKQMTERLTALLPEDMKQQTYSMLQEPRKDFEVAYRLDCRNLCADFREDIDFRFSLGLTALMNRFIGARKTRAVLSGYPDAVPRPVPMTPQTPSNEAFRVPSQQESELLVTLISTFGSLYSRTTVGALAITGVVAKAAGWRVLAVCGAIYGLLYVYERLTWTNKAKERKFKRQYVDYASSKLKLIVDLTSANCSHQVQQELSSTFARLCRQVDLAKNELQDELKELGKEMGKLEEVGGKAKVLKNKAGWLDNELNSFIHQYIRQQEC